MCLCWLTHFGQICSNIHSVSTRAQMFPAGPICIVKGSHTLTQQQQNYYPIAASNVNESSWCMCAIIVLTKQQ